MKFLKFKSGSFLKDSFLKNNSKFLKFGILSFFLVGCLVNPPAGVFTNPLNQPVYEPQEPNYNYYYDDQYLDDRNANDQDREDILNYAYRGAQRDLCEGNYVCENICEEIFNRHAERVECEQLSYSRVKKLDVVFKSFENPRLRSLEELDVFEGGDVDIFLNLDIRVLQSLVGRYSEAEAEEFLIWLAQDRDASLIFEKEDRDFTILDRLLSKINSDAFRALGENLDGSENFMDIASEVENGVALAWVHDYLFEEESNCKKDADKAQAECLKSYCELGSDMDEDYAAALLDYKFFRKYLENVIDDAINGDTDTKNGKQKPERGQWDADPGSDNSIERIGELYNWWEDLC